MATQDTVMGNWRQLKGKVKQQWGQLTDDELQQAEGNYDQLVGLIQRKTGQARTQIERTLSKFSEEGEGMLQHAAGAAREYAGQAGHALRDASERVREGAMHGYEGAHDMLRRHPTESVAAAFGTGLLIGLCIGLMVSSGSDR
jgi:uncharacterized protein YjbJ (UPF0337 family)